MYIFDKKFSACKTNLANWSRRKFKNAATTIKNLETKLIELINEPASTTNSQEIDLVKEAIAATKRREEMFWWARSQIKWLNYGDKNSKFFHATTVQRRARNCIVIIQDRVGNWLSNEEDIKNLIQDHFTCFFAANDPSNYSHIIDLIPKKVSRV